MAEPAGERLHGVILSDFNLQNLSQLLDRDDAYPAVRTRVGAFGQVVPVLMDERAEVWSPKPDFTILWSRPESIAPAFRQLLHFETIDTDAVLRDVERFAAAVVKAADRTGTVFLPLWVLTPPSRGFGLLDRRPGLGVEDLLARMNLRLAEAVASAANVYVLDADRWIRAAGADAFDPKLWYLAKTPFSVGLLQEAVQDVKAALQGIAGRARKVIILDLDNTLWGGVVGDDGWENLRLGGHDPVGEAFADFQRALKALTHRGVLLALVSKNEESTALEAIRRHPEMVLSLDDLAGWVIDWEDKAANIARLMTKLNLGLDAAVFIDDSPNERERVRSALPSVLVPDWPRDPLLYPSCLQALRCFDGPSITEEDRARSGSYVSSRKRDDLKREVGSLEDWMTSLGVRVRVEPLSEENLPRCVQLLNKTNQMNLSTRRMTLEELRAWVLGEGRFFWAYRVSDRLGDSGLTGLGSLDVSGDLAVCRDFVVSCRVMGKGAEETMLAHLVQEAERRHARSLRFEYLANEKNKPLLRFLEAARLDREGNVFLWREGMRLEKPPHVELDAAVHPGLER